MSIQPPARRTFKNISFIGCGLLGGSIAKAVAQSTPGVILKAFLGTSSEDTTTLVQSNLFASVQTTPFSPTDEDLIIIAAPISAINAIASSLRQHTASLISRGATVIDTCSIKSLPAMLLSPMLQEGFIACHPIAGKEQGGFINSEAGLLHEKSVIITHAGHAEPYIISPEYASIGSSAYGPLAASALQQGMHLQNHKAHNSPNSHGSPGPSLTKAQHDIVHFWINQAKCGQVIAMSHHQHDEIYASVSHLPQLLAFGYAKVISSMGLRLPSTQFCRLCTSPYSMWEGVFSGNRQALKSALSSFALYADIAPIKNIPSPQSFALQQLPVSIATALLSSIPESILPFGGSGLQSLLTPIEAPTPTAAPTPAIPTPTPPKSKNGKSMMSAQPAGRSTGPMPQIPQELISACLALLDGKPLTKG